MTPPGFVVTLILLTVLYGIAFWRGRRWERKHPKAPKLNSKQIIGEVVGTSIGPDGMTVVTKLNDTREARYVKDQIRNKLVDGHGDTSS